jgi:glycosyltransferase involved in cell wall biosynthesis
MSTGRRVLIVGSYAPSLIGFRGDLITAMVEKGHAVAAAAPRIDASTADALRKLGAEPVEVPISNSSLNPFALIRSVRAMRALIGKKRPDVIIAYTIKPVLASAFATTGDRTRRVVSLITGAGYAFTGGPELKRRISRVAASILYRLALRRVDVVIFQNPDDERLFRKLGLVGREQATKLVNGSGVDLVRFSPAPMPRSTTFLMIARLLKDKGIREFAQAAKRVKAERPDVAVILVGDLDPSPDSLTRSELDELIRCGIDYRGFVHDVRPVISECTVYVLPSYREGTPHSVLQAMAMGRAIITTDAPGCRETVRNGENGFLVRPRDCADLADAMMRFVKDHDLARSMGGASRRIAETKYDVRDVTSKLLLYAGLSQDEAG